MIRPEDIDPSTVRDLYRGEYITEEDTQDDPLFRVEIYHTAGVTVVIFDGENSFNDALAFFNEWAGKCGMPKGNNFWPRESSNGG